MPYLVNEIFHTIQGEGYWSGRAAVFCRFSRCNLWSGREEDRATAICQFCDTDFTSYTKYTTEELVARIQWAWGGGRNRMVVFTGGEPTLQLDNALLDQIHSLGFYTAIETNGTRPVPDVDWVCVSPKANAELNVHEGDELKLVYPQEPDPYRYLNLKFDHFWISPMDGPNLAENTAAAVKYVLQHPQWRLNTQTHKMIGVR